MRVRLKVNPRASANRVTGVEAAGDGAVVLKVAVTAAPEGGKANRALIKILARQWRLPKSSLGITAGAGDRRKTLLVEGDTAILMAQFDHWMEEEHERRQKRE